MKRKNGLADSPLFLSPEKQISDMENKLGKKASKLTSLQASNIASKQASLLAKMKDVGRLKATNAATFRFPTELLENLEEIEYQLRKQYKIKATKNIILVGALAMLLYEFEEDASKSTLYQYLADE